MKTKILLTAIAIAAGAIVTLPVGPASASMMCAHDWVREWSASAFLPAVEISYGYAPNRQASVSWAVSSVAGSAGRQVVLGMATCSSRTTAIQGGMAVFGPMSTDPGPHCWCKMVSPLMHPIWVFHSHIPYGAEACRHMCARNCVTGFRDNLAFRRAILDTPI